MSTGKYASTLGFAGILAGSLIVGLDAVALSPSLPTIEDALHANTFGTYWAGVAYTLGSATCLPLFPAFSNAVGRRPVCMVALVMFLIGTIVCGLAHSIGMLLAGRIIQGVGGGGIVGMMYVVMTDLFTPAWRPKALGINGLVWLVGLSTGPVMGGGFSSHVSWRWIFWIAIPINVIALVLVTLFLDIPRTIAGTINERAMSLKHMDFVGAILLLGSLSAFLIPITWGGVMHSWSDDQTLVPLILGVVGLAVWLVYEAKVAANPIFPLAILNDRTVAISLIDTFAIGLLQFALTFYLPLYYQIVKGYSALISGVAILPETLLSGPTTFIVGIVISKTGKYKTIVLASWAIMTLGCGLLQMLDQHTSVPQWIFINVPLGIAIGASFTSTTVSAQAPVAEEHIAIASGLIAFIRAIGQALGIAIGNAIVQNVVKHHLESSNSLELRENAALIAENAASPMVISSFMQHESSQANELLSAYVSALRSVWWLLFGISCFCGVLSLFMRDVGLGQTGEAKADAEKDQEPEIQREREARVSEA